VERSAPAIFDGVMTCRIRMIEEGLRQFGNGIMVGRMRRRVKEPLVAGNLVGDEPQEGQAQGCP
jgi:hypothetical protein